PSRFLWHERKRRHRGTEAQRLGGFSMTLQSFPSPDRWDDWRGWDPRHWPREVERRSLLVPPICFNCEAACGLLAYVDKDGMRVRKFEGNPVHPASRGRNCANGPAAANQVNEHERSLY